MALALKRLLLLGLPAALLASPQPLTLEEFLAQYRRSDPEDKRCALVARLGAGRDPAAADVLGPMLANEQSYPYLQCYIVMALCDEGSPASLQRALDGLRPSARRDPCIPLFTRRVLTSVRNPKGLSWMATQAWKEPELREDLAWALAQNLAWKDPAFFLDHLGPRREKEPRLRAAAASGLCRLDDPRTAEAVLQAALVEEEPGVLMRLLPAAGRLAPPRALPLLERGIRHPDVRARLGALEGLSWAASDKSVREPALALLVQALSSETGRLRADAARALEAQTGKTFGTDASQWKAWLKGNGIPLPPGFQEVQTHTPRHLGVEMPSRRIVFLVETSQEMIEDRTTRQPSDRLARVKKDLQKRIEALPPDVSFDVVAYGQSVFRWKPEMTPATKAAKDEARAWVNRLAGSGLPDLGAGLQAAWDLGGAEPADTVVLVAAGQPVERGTLIQFSGPLHFSFSLSDWVALQQRYRSVVLHTVGVGTSANKQVLKDLAAAAGGTYRTID